MRAYSQDLRDRVLNAVQRNERPSEIARNLQVSRMWVYEVRRSWQHEGRRGSLPMGGHRRSRIAHLEPTLRAWIKEQADLTLAEMCERLGQQGVQIKVPALWHQLDKWGLSFKKNAARQRARTPGRATGAQPMAGRSGRMGHAPAGLSG